MIRKAVPTALGSPKDKEQDHVLGLCLLHLSLSSLFSSPLGK
jgi:hypothetical protein